MAKRTIENCSMIKKAIKEDLGHCGTDNGKCIGYAGADGDEPHTTCQKCKLNICYKEDSFVRVEILSNDIVMIRGHIEPTVFAQKVLDDEGIKVQDFKYIHQKYAKAVPCNTGEYACLYNFRNEPCKGSFPVTYYNA